MKMRELRLTVSWNIFLLTLGGFVAGLGLKCVAVPQGFISGGFFGVGLLLYYSTELLSPAIWYVLINVPVFILAWRFVSRRFFFYTLYGLVVSALAVQFIPWTFFLEDTLLAAIFAGCLYGIGLSIMLRSFGSDGGLAIIGIILNQRWNIKLGGFSLFFNLGLFCLAFMDRPVDLVLYSILFVFVQTSIVDYSMRIVNERKLVLIISDHSEAIGQIIMHGMKRGCTIIGSRGAYTDTERPILMTVVQNFQLKRLEELVFEEDPKAFIIVENTYDVIGQGFSQLHRY